MMDRWTRHRWNGKDVWKIQEEELALLISLVSMRMIRTSTGPFRIHTQWEGSDSACEKCSPNSIWATSGSCSHILVVLSHSSTAREWTNLSCVMSYPPSSALASNSSPSKRVKRIVLTGGPGIAVISHLALIGALALPLASFSCSPSSFPLFLFLCAGSHLPSLRWR